MKIKTMRYHLISRAIVKKKKINHFFYVVQFVGMQLFVVLLGFLVSLEFFVSL